MTAVEPGLLERRMCSLLKAGVVFSAVLLLMGLVASIAGVLPSAASWCLNGGLVVLMATPFLRVLCSVVEYLRTRDWFFAAISLAVLGVLVATVITAVHAR